MGSHTRRGRQTPRQCCCPSPYQGAETDKEVLFESEVVLISRPVCNLLQMRHFFEEHIPWDEMRVAVCRAVCVGIQPPKCCTVHTVNADKDVARKEILLDVPHAVLNLAFRLRIARATQNNAVTHFLDKFLERFHKDDIAEVFADDEHSVLIVHDCLRSAAEIPEGVFVRFDSCSRVERLRTEIHEFHPAERKHHAEEVHADYPARTCP